MIRALMITLMSGASLFAADEMFELPGGMKVQNFTYAGIAGGIPKVDGPVFDITTFGATPSDKTDDQPAIMAAVEAATKGGGGVVFIPEGTFDLDSIVRIQSDNIVFRGASRDKSVLSLRNADVDPSLDKTMGVLHFEAAQRKIDFQSVKLSAPVTAGDTVLVLAGNDYAVGDILDYEGSVIDLLVRVEKVDGDKITINQPWRTNTEAGDGRFRRYGTVKRAGVENLTIQTTREINTDGVGFAGVWEGWVHGVNILKPGKFPVGFNHSRYIEIRDCLFDDAWKKGSGGVGYGGFLSCYDGLIVNVEMKNLRHAPNFQGKANGCVIRDSTFFQSDAQYHTGGAAFNLLENCTITLDASKPGLHSSHTLRTARPGIDKIHSAAGPGNVIWNNDFIAEGGRVSAADFGHRMDDWVVGYNRWVVSGDTGNPVIRVWYDCASNFHFVGNVVAARSSKGGGFVFTLKEQGASQTGNSFVARNNRFFGWSAVDDHWWTGPIGPDINEDNQLTTDFDQPERPTPPVDGKGVPITSIADWQRDQRQH